MKQRPYLTRALNLLDPILEVPRDSFPLRQHKSGAEAMFWKAGSADWLPEGFGVKFYYSAIDRDYAWNRQKDGSRICGYMTEVAEKDEDIDREDRIALNHRAGLKRAYKQTFGSEARDIRGANIGRIDGKVVMIDFGPLTDQDRVWAARNT
jgi:hypothetical protein